MGIKTTKNSLILGVCILALHATFTITPSFADGAGDERGYPDNQDNDDSPSIETYRVPPTCHTTNANGSIGARATNEALCHGLRPADTTCYQSISTSRYSGGGGGDGGDHPTSYEGAGGATFDNRDDAIAHGGTGRSTRENANSTRGVRSGDYHGRASGRGNDDSDSDSGGCFMAGTLVNMADGSLKAIEDIKLGDEVQEGGKVYAIGSFLINDLYDYKGVQVSGSHAVNEDGYWMRVRDSSFAKLISTEETVVYVHANEHNRIIIDGIEFADYSEVGRQHTTLHQEMSDQMIKLLNQREREKRSHDMGLSLVS